MLNALFEKWMNKPKTKDVAKKRLQFALVYDKLDVSDDILENLQRDIVEVVSRYFVIDQDSLKLDIQRDQELSALVVNTPILRAVRQRAQTA